MTQIRLLALSTSAASLAIAVAAQAAPEPIRPIPERKAADPARVELGRRLFHDPRLSANNRVSCASCHDLARGGVDGQKLSRGFDGRLAEFNTPTVYNAVFNFRQSWQGKARSLHEQADGVVRNPVEMGSDWNDVVRKLAQDAEYRSSFSALYKDGVTKPNIQDALATFGASLTTPGARFDRYLRGDADAITPLEKAGYAKFKQFGCVSCHQGVNVGGNMFQRFGVFAKPPGSNAGELFKVPGLRNVELTAPYLHDGSAPTLDDAVDRMFRYQLGRKPSKADTEAIVAFLRTLTGPVEKKQ